MDVAQGFLSFFFLTCTGNACISTRVCFCLTERVFGTVKNDLCLENIFTGLHYVLVTECTISFKQVDGF